MTCEEKVENIIPTPSVEESETKALKSPFFVRGDWPAKTWWEQYGSKELNQLIETALEENPTIQAAEQKIEFAKNEAVVAGSTLYPLVYFDATDHWQYLSKNGLYRALNPSIPLNNQQIDFNLSFFYEFDFWGKWRNLYDAAISRIYVAIAEEAQAELIISTALAQSYFALKTNLVRKKLYQQLYDVRKDYFELQQKMLKHSLYSKLTPLLSEERVFQAKQWLYNIDQEIALEKHIVNILAGRGPDAPLRLDEPLADLPKKLAVPSDISLELLSRRPDLMAYLCKVDVLAYEVGAAKADYWPNIDITAVAGFEASSWSKLFEWASKTLGALPGLSLPIYTAGEIGANIDAKKALFDEAVYEYNNLILQSFQQVADLLAISRSVYGEKEKQSEIVANALARYVLFRLRQKSGLDNALTVYEAIEALIQEQLDNIQLLYQQYVVNINLTKALGGGFLCSEEEPNE